MSTDETGTGGAGSGAEAPTAEKGVNGEGAKAARRRRRRRGPATPRPPRQRWLWGLVTPTAAATWNTPYRELVLTAPDRRALLRLARAHCEDGHEYQPVRLGPRFKFALTVVRQAKMEGCCDGVATDGTVAEGRAEGLDAGPGGEA